MSFNNTEGVPRSLHPLRRGARADRHRTRDSRAGLSHQADPPDRRLHAGRRRVDINARLIGPKVTEYLGQQVIVENRPGAGTNIANEHVAKSPADGYTLLINTAAVAIQHEPLYNQVPVRYAARFHRGLGVLDEPQHHGGARFGTRQKRQGADRAREIQARRAQFLLGGQRHHAAPVRRALQGAHQEQHRSCPVPGQRAIHDRADQRRSRPVVRQHPGHLPARQIRPPAPHRQSRAETRGATARRADHEGIRRGGHGSRGLVRRARPVQDAARNRQHARRGDRQGLAGTRHQAAAARPGRRAYIRQHARRIQASCCVKKSRSGPRS
ncbi:MAG: hypothetical protein KIT18_02415 [Burkholderiales bacterium]|nr:hypothetical protein [Burkholderiales bacterium]